MTELKVGDRIRDNDPRMKGRVLRVTFVGAVTGIQAEDSIGRLRWYDPERIHTDGKPRRTGFSLVAAKSAEGAPPSEGQPMPDGRAT